MYVHDMSNNSVAVFMRLCNVRNLGNSYRFAKKSAMFFKNFALCLLYLPLDDGSALWTAVGNHNFLDEFGVGVGFILVCCLPRGFVLMLLRSSSRIRLFRTHRS